MKDSLFLNGVFKSVLEEILEAQKDHPGKTFYLQPHSSQRIVKLKENPPTKDNPTSLYISTTKNLDKICYSAEIIDWENKQEIPPKRREVLNNHISKYQPKEEEIYLTANGTESVNLISIVNLKKLPNQFSVKNLIKTRNGEPVKPRKQSGNWVYVKELPNWFGLEETSTEENLEEELEKGIEESSKLSDEARQERLSQASKKPEQIQVLSKGYRRNPDVIVEVLKRADGECERCEDDAPFLRASDGTPYLEIHHKKPLAEGGNDTVENAMALCPNCHREVHYGQ
ncbi:HNH endonuclease [Fodinibius halophilus]|uniref:HNH endonuclease n=1 Tax=Fodinibius halophilus TaxID=1736908 RepID=A0A6M1T7K0_9BACT|nr:HNH endonuclease signature motif containing protein [Fodinibius halophilus]NGP89365.1 HNH endonuclease [Fodinibius halophilus]